FLCERGHLPQPLLYLSAFFERYRDEYYTRLLEVSRSGDWQEWVRFFLRGIATQATDAVSNSTSILDLQQRYRLKLHKRNGSRITTATLEELFQNPYITTPRLAHRLKVSFPAAQSSINTLMKLGILKEMTGRPRNRIYCAEELLRIIEGAVPEDKKQH